MEPSARPVGVVIMAKPPLAGRAKTRLCPPLGFEQAASLYAAMLADRAAQVERLEGVVPAIAFAAHDGAPVPLDLVPPGFRLVPQPAGDLGVGLQAAAAHFLDQATPVLLVDSDSPTLPQVLLEEAVERLRAGAELVVGPADDGGYHFIGLGRSAPSLFREIPWSTPRVLGATLERAAAAGLRVHQFAPWWDVDTGADLERLRHSLLGATWPARTAAWLRRHLPFSLPPPADSAPPAAPVPEEDRWRTPWQRVSSRPVYATPWISVREDHVRMPDGAPTLYSVIQCGHCVGALPFLDEETVLLVRQYRYVAGRVTWEMPTGGVHEGERPEEAMRRELGEEARVHPGRLDYLGAYHTSKSVMEETAHLYVARDLSPAAAVADDTEFIRVERVPFREVLAMVRSGEIVDGMTIIAVLRVALGDKAWDPTQP